MTTIQARRLLRLARSVSKAKDYDQNDYGRCCFAAGDKMWGCVIWDVRLGLSDDEYDQVFAFTEKDDRLPTAKQKAAQIRMIVRRHHPGLVGSKSK